MTSSIKVSSILRLTFSSFHLIFYFRFLLPLSFFSLLQVISSYFLLQVTFSYFLPLISSYFFLPLLFSYQFPLIIFSFFHHQKLLSIYLPLLSPKVFNFTHHFHLSILHLPHSTIFCTCCLCLSYSSYHAYAFRHQMFLQDRLSSLCHIFCLLSLSTWVCLLRS